MRVVAVEKENSMTTIKDKVSRLLKTKLEEEDREPGEVLTIVLWEVEEWDDKNEAMILLLFDQMEGNRYNETVKAHGKTWKLERIITGETGLVALTLHERLATNAEYRKLTKEGYMAWWLEKNPHMLEEPAKKPEVDLADFERFEAWA